MAIFTNTPANVQYESGTLVDVVSGAAFNAGEYIRRGADGTFTKALANSLANSSGDVMVACFTASGANQQGKALQNGTLVVSGGTAGTVVLLSGVTSGAGTPAADVIATMAVVVLGVYLSATRLRFNPINTGIVL